MENDLYGTSDTALATYLACIGFEIKDFCIISPNNARRSLYLFDFSDRVLKSKQDFYNREDSIPILHYEETKRQVLKILKNVKVIDKSLITELENKKEK